MDKTDNLEIVQIVLERFYGESSSVTVLELTPDASTRRYFRAISPLGSVVVCLYGESFGTAGKSFLDTYELLRESGLPVPIVLEVFEDLGVILQEDLGDLSLTQYFESKGEGFLVKERLLEAIELVVKFQAASKRAEMQNRVCAGLAFDKEKLDFEMGFFVKHFFGSLLKMDVEQVLNDVGVELSVLTDLLSVVQRVLVHRDFHSGNLMIDGHGRLRVIDFQDARMGPVTYDLVPLLVERRLDLASAELIDWGIDQYLAACRRLGYEPPLVNTEDVRDEFGLMTIQRELKAVGSFAWLSAEMGRSEQYLKFIPVALGCVVRELNVRKEVFPRLLEVLTLKLQDFQ